MTRQPDHLHLLQAERQRRLEQAARRAALARQAKANAARAHRGTQRRLPRRSGA